MEVTDASGMVTNTTSQSTPPPSVNDPIIELTEDSPAVDPNPALDIGTPINVDSDGDGITNNDEDWSGLIDESFGIPASTPDSHDSGLARSVHHCCAETTNPGHTISPDNPLTTLVIAAALLIISIRLRGLVPGRETHPSESEQKEMFAR